MQKNTDRSTANSGPQSDLETQIRMIVEAQLSRANHISGIRPADEKKKPAAEELYKRTAAVRGRPLQFSYIGSGLGRGPYVELEDGSVKLDLINGIGIHVMGHNHPRILAAAVRGALCDVVMQGNLQPNKEYLEISEKLARLASRNSRLKHVWLATCGSMANENALKICRQKKTPARKIIAMEHAFAGRSTMMAEVTDNPALKEGLPSYNEVLRVAFYDKNDPKSSEKSLAQLTKHIEENKNDICAFTFEPMQGEGGYNSAPREFFVPLLELCRKHNVPVWLDEVQTFSRTGEFFAFETLGLGEYVDVCTIAKTLQDGATLYTADLNPRPGLIAGTFSGGSSSMRAGIEILEILEKENYMGPKGKVVQIHQEFVRMLNELNTSTCKGLLRDAGGMGLMVAVTPIDGTKEKTNQLMMTLFKNGLICYTCGHGPYRLRFLLPAVLTSQDIHVAKGIVEKSVQEL